MKSRNPLTSAMRAFLYLFSVFYLSRPGLSFSPAPESTGSRSDRRLPLTQCQATPPQRREFLAQALTFAPGSLVPILLDAHSSSADDSDEDLTSKLFNPDGSVRDGVQVEAKERSVGVTWGPSDELSVFIDAKSVESNQNQSSGDGSRGQVRATYDLPEKWSDGSGGDELYYDRSEGTNAKACKRITVYRAPGVADVKRLKNAATIGVAKSLSVPPLLDRLNSADIISGRVANRDGQAYYEFDMAAAPLSCSNSKENLGLGFCPYDNIFLLSATIINDRLYVISVECDSTRIWKLASAELKRVRSSFTVQEMI